MKKIVVLLAVLTFVACGKEWVDDVKPRLYVESFEQPIDVDFQYGYESDHFRFEHFYNEEFGYWGGFAWTKMFDADATHGLYENQFAVYNEMASHGGGALVYYYDSYNEPCDIVFKSEESVVRLSSVKLNLTTYTYASITDEDINDYARVFAEGDYLKVVFYGVDAFGRTVGEGAECYVVDYRDGKRFVADNWQEFYLPGILSNRVRVTIETSDVGEWGANTPLYICMDDLTYTRL